MTNSCSEPRFGILIRKIKEYFSRRKADIFMVPVSIESFQCYHVISCKIAVITVCLLFPFSILTSQEQELIEGSCGAFSIKYLIFRRLNVCDFLGTAG